MEDFFFLKNNEISTDIVFFGLNQCMVYIYIYIESSVAQW